MLYKPIWKQLSHPINSISNSLITFLTKSYEEICISKSEKFCFSKLILYGNEHNALPFQISDFKKLIS